ncbi:MAG: MBOAT family protein [Paludibacteraceae bacterium]|nr:MBOAT family protein [Paludibacteraceae bacterium]
MLGLIVGVSACDFVLARLIEKSENKKPLLWLTIVVNLGVLFFFKYCNFFLETFYDLASLFSNSESNGFSPLKIILPVGISFYTFQGLAYVIDVYKGKIESSKDPIAFFAFVSFFPQLVAGPIERASDLLPQFYNKYKFNYEEIRTGLLIIAFGLFKKVVIADRIAVYVDSAYGDLTNVGGVAMWLALLFFAFQLYLDFSAYSEIAVGVAKLFGFNLHDNFKSPYTAITVKEFWNRWHISLTSWFRDYLYFTLGGNRVSLWRAYLNVLIVFTVSGLWHGASWNFVVWGFLNGLFLVVFDKWLKLKPQGFAFSILSWALTFFLWMISLIFFRAATFSDSISVFSSLIAQSTDVNSMGLCAEELKFALYLVFGLWIFEFVMSKYADKLKNLIYNYSFSFVLRWVLYVALPLSIIYLGIYGDGSDNNFIYFQF